MKTKYFKSVIGCSLILVTIASAGAYAYNYRSDVGVKLTNSIKDYLKEDGDLNNGSKKQEIMKLQDKVGKLDEIPMINLPKGIRGIKSETSVNQSLRDLIIEYYQIPEEYYETTRYYYNYVDLNKDGVNEIFVVVMGPYTSGTGGSSALWVVENGGKLHVNQDFKLVHTPVVISDTVTNGARELIVPYYGGGVEDQYSIMTCSDGAYTRVSDGTKVKTLESVTGDAIIANDIIAEVEAGNMGLNLLSK
ncbi:hypothetical protein Curi_c04630 [Gottschalkia acidurici 9a]|uniref:Uncharacterized protein n=1 Tax=Gottschalkia acidurici (strain ATCC 7906 / DSM 604 / BCRC 14475 / CIP 104303 / KCTC 5404 / NCIMB 10678 / 9a) TaxID=1128398 RepID=K0AUI6_GOTA9|nr:hypothetical protein [Gottschalkia acidurici]AFS77538.1 hypothetical protein Curi_c04630 [Gottschalkia acidurici 9a]